MSSRAGFTHVWFLLILFPLLPSEPTAAFKVPTHKDLTKFALERSDLANGDLLTATLPEFWLGPEQRVDDKTVAEWIRFGAQKEDDPPWPVNHFHDPTSGWAFAGLFHAFHSSVFWQQLPGPSIVHHQWPQARDLYLRALLETDAGERDRLFKEMFRNIGHIVHVPETRVEDGVTPMSRYVILRDADTDPDFQMFVEDAILDVDDVNIGPNAWGRCNLYAIRNDYNRGSIEHDVINPNQDLVTFRRFPTTASYRGWTGFNLQYLYETEGGFGWALGSGGFDSCLSSLESASPNLTYAPSELAPEE